MTFLEKTGARSAATCPETVAACSTVSTVAAAIGANCTLGPRGMQRVVEALARATSLPLSAQPNAGPPMIVRGHFEYRRNEEYFARAAETFVDLGASIIGGCCGTTPQHIDAIVRHLRRSPNARPVGAAVRRRGTTRVDPARDSVSSRVADKLSRGSFILGCELATPEGSDPEYAVGEAEALLNDGADALVVTALPHSRATISPVSFGLLLLDRLGIEPILTVSTFDKSILGLQADLLGAHAFGLRTVICTTATPPPEGDYPDLGGVFTVTSVELIEALRALNAAREHTGTRMRRATAFSIGALADPSAADFDWELRRTRQKIEAGADFILTAPVFSLGDLERFVEALGDPTVPVLLGVTPLRDFEHAEFLHYEAAGVTIPERVASACKTPANEPRSWHESSPPTSSAARLGSCTASSCGPPMVRPPSPAPLAVAGRPRRHLGASPRRPPSAGRASLNAGATSASRDRICGNTTNISGSFWDLSR